jgi:hypothetical protein
MRRWFRAFREARRMKKKELRIRYRQGSPVGEAYEKRFSFRERFRKALDNEI